MDGCEISLRRFAPPQAATAARRTDRVSQCVLGGKVMRQRAQLPTLMVVVEGSQFRSVNVVVVVVVEKSCTANTVGFSHRLAK